MSFAARACGASFATRRSHVLVAPLSASTFGGIKAQKLLRRQSWQPGGDVNFKVMLDDWLANNLQKVPIMDRALQSWSFWAHVEQAGAGCRAWWTAASYVALRLPSSCTAERFFSVAGGTTKKTQASLLDENQEIRHLLAFNNRTTMCDDHDLV